MRDRALGVFKRSLGMAALGVAALCGTAAGQAICSAVDDQTRGGWIGTYGQCAHVLAAYNHAGQCQVPILTGDRRCDSPTCTDGTRITCDGGSFVGGVSPDLLDCRSGGDLDGDGVRDFFYDVYTPSGDGRSNRILVDPDGSCSRFNGLWFSDFRESLRYSVAGVPAGRYRLAVYMMSWDSHDRRQTVQVCVGGDCSAAAQVDYDYYWGTYEIFDIQVAAGDQISLEHTLTASANAVVSGLFFDAVSSSGCATKACWRGPGQRDQATRGAWVGTYGADGYALFNRTGQPARNLTGLAAEATTLVGGFAGTVRVVAGPPVMTWLWETTRSECGTGRSYGNTAFGWVWGCDLDNDPRALQNPGTCANAQNCSARPQRVAATWDDAGERFLVGPSLFVDLEVRLPGIWRLSVYAVDFDSTLRRQRYHLYQWRTRDPLPGHSPVDIGAFSNGKYVTWTLEGPFRLTLRAEAYEGINAVISGLFVDPAPGGTCDGSSNREYCSFTIGGWGTGASGNNPGSIRDAHWDRVYGPGGLVIGPPECRQLTFTGPAAVEAYLPCGGTPSALAAPLTDPKCGETVGGKNVLASQVTGLRLNVDYSCAGALGGGCLSALRIESGPFTGLSICDFLDHAERALTCGDTTIPGLGTFSLSDFNDTASRLNERFVDCRPGPAPVVCGP